MTTEVSKQQFSERRLRSYDLALWYSAKAKLYLREGEELFGQFRYPESVSSFGASIEFGLKAVCAFLGADYIWKHSVSEPLIFLSTQYPNCSGKLSRAALISARWVGANEQARTLVNYGSQDGAAPATKIVERKDVELIRGDAAEVCDLLQLVEIRQRFVVPRRLGILDGFVQGPEHSEKPCAEYAFSDFMIDDWERRFSEIFDSGKSKYEIEKIPVSRVGNEFAAIINPFGEAYPESDVQKRLAFDILQNYMRDGGVLVNVAGFPFFYAWDVAKGMKEPVVDMKTLIPASIIVEGEKVLVGGFLQLLNFAGSLLWREIGGATTIDTRELSGINPAKVYQKEEDKKLAGDIANVGGDTVHEFRALRKETRGLIPLLRAQRPDFGEIYPIAAVRVGYGYLIACGMNTKSQSEFEKIVSAVDNFCDWLAHDVKTPDPSSFKAISASSETQQR